MFISLESAFHGMDFALIGAVGAANFWSFSLVQTVLQGVLVLRSGRFLYRL